MRQGIAGVPKGGGTRSPFVTDGGNVLSDPGQLRAGQFGKGACFAAAGPDKAGDADLYPNSGSDEQWAAAVTEAGGFLGSSRTDVEFARPVVRCPPTVENVVHEGIATNDGLHVAEFIG